jgi:CelD/BcsL family acetyltransferase involved in cellulose biosynthesis
LGTGIPTLSIGVVDAIDPLEDEWRELAEFTHAAPFMYPGWFRAWWSAFGVGTLRVVTVRRDGQLVGLVPMQARRGAWAALTNAHTPAFDLLALGGDAMNVLAQGLVSTGRRELAIAPLEEDGAAVRALRDATDASGYRSVVRPAGRAPYLRLATELAAHERSVSRNLRHDIDRRLRRLCESGVVCVEVADGSERLDELLEEGFRVEWLGWKGREGTAIASSHRTAQFYGAVARWAASVGWLRLPFLRLDGRAIAFQLDFELPPSYYSLKIGYDPAYERFSPGKLLAYTMVSRAISRGLSTYELLGKDEPWKYRWTDERHERIAFRAFSPSPAGRVASSVFLYGRPLARRVPFAARIAAAVRR